MYYERHGQDEAEVQWAKWAGAAENRHQDRNMNGYAAMGKARKESGADLDQEGLERRVSS